jgi:hypothetical protein
MTTRAVMTSLHEISASIVFPLSEPFALRQPFPGAESEKQSSGQRLRSILCD